MSEEQFVGTAGEENVAPVDTTPADPDADAAEDAHVEGGGVSDAVAGHRKALEEDAD